MYCDDCGSTVHIRMQEYVERKEKLGVVLCYTCRNGEARAHPPRSSSL